MNSQALRQTNQISFFCCKPRMKEHLLLPLIAIMNIICGQNIATFPFKRIVHGRQASIEEFPYQVSIEVSGRHNCGGSLLTDRIILTAAHCVTQSIPLSNVNTDLPKEYIRVRLGASYANDIREGVLRKVATLRRHPSYQAKPVRNDLALILLSHPVEITDKVTPILLSEKSPRAGEMAWVTGYGSKQISQTREMENEKTTRELRVVKLPIVPLRLCRVKMSRKGLTVAEGMICAGYRRGHKDACKGDSGGPMVIGNRLVGVTAWGVGCGMEGVPGVYTDVAKHLSWIEDTIIELNELSDNNKKQIFSIPTFLPLFPILGFTFTTV